MVMKFGMHRKELSAGYRKTTNNRMELLAVIVALETMKSTDHRIDIFTDSKYVCEAVEKGWVFNWQKKNFEKKANRDLWERFLRVYPRFKVKFHWVKGHAGNQENERCDELATAAADGFDLKIDSAYEAQSG